jgi:hypothetical protein
MGQYAYEVVVACFIVFIMDGQEQNFLPVYLMSVGNKQNNWALYHVIMLTMKTFLAALAS